MEIKAISVVLIEIIVITSGLASKTLPVTRRIRGCFIGNEVNRLKEQIRHELFESVRVPDCGEGIWKQLIALNMSNAQETCPLGGWSEELHPRRSCSQNITPGCSLTELPVGTTFQRVCGRALGYASGTNDAFEGFTPDRRDVNYVDGINIFIATSPPLHLWTFAVDQTFEGLPRCPCSNVDEQSYSVPDYVGSNYFCDTHSDTNTLVWDGIGCEAATCCNYNNPPWFKRSFNSLLSNDLLIRICTDEDASNEFVGIIELELYVQ